MRRKAKTLFAKCFTTMIAFAMLLTMVPGTVLAAPRDASKQQVRVIVENTTFTSADDSDDDSEPAWSGTLLDEWVVIDEDSTMMSCIVTALKEKGYEQTGAESNYIDSINGLTAFDGSVMSGWMGTLNDWFTDVGFGGFTVKDGTLSAGDEIRIMFTMDCGEDIGGPLYGTDTRVQAVEVKAYDSEQKALGDITWDKAFDKDTKEYKLTLPEGTAYLTVVPTAACKLFQVRTYSGEPDVKASGYKRGEMIPVAGNESFSVVSADTSWPSMGISEEAVIYKFNYEVTVPEPEPELTDVTVQVVPTTAAVTFYTDATATNELPKKWITDKGTQGKYHQYDLTVPEGTYAYRGVDGETNIGGGVITVSDTNKSFILCRTNFYVNSNAFTEVGDYVITKMQDPQKNDMVAGDAYISSSKVYTPYLLWTGTAANTSYTWDYELGESKKDDYYKGTVSAVSVATNVSATKSQTISATQYKMIKVTVPKDATTKFYSQTKNYVVKEVAPVLGDGSMDAIKDNGDGTVTYLFKGKTAHSNYQYRVSKAGEITQAGFLADGSNVTVEFPMGRNPKSTTSSLNYDDQGILLNINSQNKLSMNVGDTFKLRAFRGAWQIVNSQTANIMLEPDFHYEILSGDDVIRMTPVTANEDGVSCNGNAKDNWVNIKALKKGTAIVAAYYDALDVFGAFPDTTTISTFGATDPERYGIFVVTVGDDENITWNPITEDGDWDAEFDTIYYNGDAGVFAFQPEETVQKVTVRNSVGTTLGAEQSISPSGDGSYEVPVTAGTNIVAVTTAKGTDYQVVRAKKINYTITNNTTKESKVNDAPEIKTGDSVTISFDKLQMPIPKFSGIYNPGYLGTGKTAYMLNDTALLTSKGTQYDFSVNNDITFVAHFAGENNLKGYISLSSMGSDFGEHRGVTDAGVPTNMNASEKFGSFGSLPDISFTVIDSEEPASYEDATKITGISVVGGLNTYTNAFNWNAVKNDTKNWTKTTAQMKDWPLIAKVTATDYNNTIKLKYWYDGEEVNEKTLFSGVSTEIKDFALDADKILNLQVEIAPLDASLGAPVVYNYLVFPGSTNQKYVHPVIKNLSVSAEGSKPELTPALNTSTTDYVLMTDDAEKVTLNGEQLIQIYNTSTAADMSDEVVLTKQKDGKPVGDPITILEKGQPNNPNRYWTLENLDITDADAFEIKVTSYVDSKYSRTYRFDLEEKPAEKKDYKEVLDATNEVLKEMGTPGTGSIGGDWMVIGLARNGEEVSEEYLEEVAEYIEDNMNPETKRLDKNKSTENSRLIVALTSMGINAKDFEGVDLFEGLNEMKYLKRQGINGPIWALIALDCGNYPEVEGDVTREALIEEILSKALANGGWALSGTKADPDMTGMAIQALAPYYNSNKDVKDAVDKALEAISESQQSTGGFVSWGSDNSESSAQILTALAALGIDSVKDSRFVKNGNSGLDGLLRFALKDGGFAHVLTTTDGYEGGEYNQMATEQGFYALVAYDRMLNGKNSLYDMTDVFDWEENKKAEDQAAAEKVDELIDEIGEVTVDSKDAIETAEEAYGKLTDDQKALVTKKAVLEKARAEYDKLTEKKEYKIVDGAKQEVKAGEAATFRSEADFSKFEAVLVDETIIDAKNYTVKEGSTIVTLKEDYTKSLSAGNHSLEIRSTDGSAKVSFAVTAENPEENKTPENKTSKVPGTGDTDSVTGWMILMAGAMVLSAVALILKKKAGNNK